MEWTKVFVTEPLVCDSDVDKAVEQQEEEVVVEVVMVVDEWLVASSFLSVNGSPCGVDTDQCRLVVEVETHVGNVSEEEGRKEIRCSIA